MSTLGRRMRAVPAAVGVVIGLGLGSPAAAVGQAPTAGELVWTPCGDRIECATATVPLDYADPSAGTLDLPVVRRPASDPDGRLGSLLVNFGGPGDPTADTLRAGGFTLLRLLNDRYDIVGFDPRGTGGTDAIDCHADRGAIGPLAQPYPRPDTVDIGALLGSYQAYVDRCTALNPRILPYVATANTARDMDRVRAGLGEDTIAYLGFSYGTFLGATYEALFPEHVGRFVLDGALDPERYTDGPVQHVREQTAAFETALGRFLQACAAHQDVCGFGGDDPAAAFDDLVAALDAAPIPGGLDERTVDGDDVREAALTALYSKRDWFDLAQALVRAARGDGTLVRLLADRFEGRVGADSYDPRFDRFFAVTSLEFRFRPRLARYFRIGAHDHALFEHFWWNSGYFDLAQALWPVRPVGAYDGPYAAPAAAPPTLVVGTRYDPATPYRDAVRLTSLLGNARLLTMRGDGHTAFPRNSTCIDIAVHAYLAAGIVPAEGTVCPQDVSFVPGGAAAPARARFRIDSLAWR